MKSIHNGDEIGLSDYELLQSELAQAKKIIEVLEFSNKFYAQNVASVWDINGEFELEFCSETAKEAAKKVAEIRESGKC